MANTKSKTGADQKLPASNGSKKSPNLAESVKPVLDGEDQPGSMGSGKGNTQLATFFEDAVKDIYWAEKALTKALPKLKKAATTEELRSAIDIHMGQTQEHVNRLEQVFQLLGKKAQAKKCDAMEGLIKEGEAVLENTEEGSMTRDAAIIVASQKVEHYEIATYGSLARLAYTMGQEEIADILETTLEEEKETDEGLTDIAENNINWEAEQEAGKNE
ncbi:ferritin-like domain-containing protein [Paraflavitalea pollutisoli]|uniref:YciE/YciF ferroxidase family protein n=1 Tax=Paraflavitalea pollutisoli TaxID=3034143 RepID=UPI0023ED7C15|nr:ferritin-like domain-containing protein [Paraflavitalea sp. H1-2-19X]